MFNILRLLKITGNTALQLAPAVVAIASPALAPIAAAVANQIIAAEASFGAGKGPEKKSAVMGSLPMAITLVEGIIGRDLIKDEDAFAKSVSLLIDSIVAVMNSLNLNAEHPVAPVPNPVVPKPV